MKVLITGISGLLGSNLAKLAYEAGYSITGISRNPSKLKFDFPVNVKLQDLSDSKLRDDLLYGIDVVIHCAANTQMGSYNNSKQNQLNTNAVKKLIDASIKSKVKRFILVSTANTCAPGDKNKPGTEENKLEISSSNLNYINSKLKAEQIALAAYKDFGLEVLIMHPTFILNPMAGAQSSNKLLHLGLKKKVLICPQGGKNLVDVRDVSQAIVSSIKNGVAGENYILSNRNYSFKEFYKLILKEQNRNAILIPLPRFVLLVLGRLSAIGELITRKPFNLNVSTAKLLNSFQYYDHSKASKHLAYQPRDVRETIKTILSLN